MTKKVTGLQTGREQFEVPTARQRQPIETWERSPTLVRLLVHVHRTGVQAVVPVEPSLITPWCPDNENLVCGCGGVAKKNIVWFGERRVGLVQLIGTNLEIDIGPKKQLVILGLGQRWRRQDRHGPRCDKESDQVDFPC